MQDLLGFIILLGGVAIAVWTLWFIFDGMRELERDFKREVESDREYKQRILDEGLIRDPYIRARLESSLEPSRRTRKKLERSVRTAERIARKELDAFGYSPSSQLP